MRARAVGTAVILCRGVTQGNAYVIDFDVSQHWKGDRTTAYGSPSTALRRQLFATRTYVASADGKLKSTVAQSSPLRTT
jgi:hypothetical protein